MTTHTDLVDEYLSNITWKSAENANSTYSHQGLLQYLSQHVISEYWLNKLYTDDVRRCVSENRFHIHDLGFLSAYCSGWSIEDILMEGFGGVPQHIQCRPAKHLNTALNQIVNFLFTLQGELAGAQALSNFDTYLAPFIRKDNLPYEQVFKYMQSFVYSLNVPTRSGFQSPFTNISLDLVCPKTVEGQPVIIGGQPHESWTYGADFQDEMDMINRAFAEVMTEGDGNGNIFTFPIPTYNLTQDFDWDSPRWQPVWSMAAKFGIPYFANFINSDLNPDDFRSMCCRLRLDIAKLNCRVGGQYGASPLTGSIGVVTINLPNLALRCRDGSKESFFTELQHTLTVAKAALEIKRRVIQDNAALYPYAAHYLSATMNRTGSHWTNHFSTIGINGMNEALITLCGEGGIAKDKAFALEVIDFIKESLQKFQIETGNLYNLEATPAESTSYKLAQQDRVLFPDREIPQYYTNSTMLPVDATDDLFEVLGHQEELQCAYTGGTVFHAFLGERLGSWKQARDLVKTMTTRYRAPYITLSPTFSICKTHGYLAGEQGTCPQCAQECLVYSRIVGYFRPVRNWNAGKTAEFKQRKTYLLPAADVGSDEAATARLEKQVADLVKHLQIAGYTKLSLGDWPGKVEAAIMFTSRCNLACPWCHNGPVVEGHDTNTTIVDVFKHIVSTPHKSLVISGGEPTIHQGLLPFMRILREAGISIKLDSNGTSPSTLRQVIDEQLADFIAMDIKCALKNYKAVTGRNVSSKTLEASISLIKGSGLPHEFRTTVVPDLVDMEDVFEAKRLAGAGGLTLQRFRSGPTNLEERFQNCREHTEKEFRAIVEQVS